MFEACVDEQIFTIHSRRLHVRLLPSYVGTQSKDMKRSFGKEGTQMADITVVLLFPVIIGGMLLVITWAMNSVP
jgi:hypothetical protein